MTHGVDGGVIGLGGVRFRLRIRINRIHRGSIVRRAMVYITVVLSPLLRRPRASLSIRYYGQGCRFPQASNEAYVAPLS